MPDDIADAASRSGVSRDRVFPRKSCATFSCVFSPRRLRGETEKIRFTWCKRGSSGVPWASSLSRRRLHVKICRRTWGVVTWERTFSPLSFHSFSLLSSSPPLSLSLFLTLCILLSFSRFVLSHVSLFLSLFYRVSVFFFLLSFVSLCHFSPLSTMMK